jgi:formimidoylglutamate deiminase
MNPPSPRKLFAPHALLPEGWSRDVLLAWDPDGVFVEVRVGVDSSSLAAEVCHAQGPVVPGMPNLHSHAFQRALAGLSEFRPTGTSGQSDSFWTWRSLMYQFALGLEPAAVEAIATHLYIEMLKVGYTAVCEFHYLHHDGHGRPYADPAQMSLRLLNAARRAGIGITLLPVLYQHAGFGGVPARPEQRRFVNTVDALLQIFERARAAIARAGPRCSDRVGIAPHSLRAVGPDALREVVRKVHEIDPGAPVHIHIAEQQREVDECVTWSGARPVQWLLSNVDVDTRWCLIHATHMSDAERKSLAASKAVVGLCPSTEANLGDGVFDAAAYAAAGGVWGIGSDSHVSVNAAQEMRLLEYTQRLTLQRRNVLASAASSHVADYLWLKAVTGGAQASARPIGGLLAGLRADFAVLCADGPLQGLAPAQLLASFVFADHGRNAVRDVWVGGQHLIERGEHALARAACEDFVAARHALLEKS